MTITRLVLNWLTWLHYDRHYQTPLLPFQLLWIDPDLISWYPLRKPSIPPWVPAGVVGGTWDKELRRFENGITFRSFRRRFVDNEEWTETPYYQFAREQIEQKGSYKGYTSPEGIEKRCKQLDDLYYDIATNGYCTQRVIDLNKDIELHRHLHLPPEMREVTVHISRKGEFLWRGGAHRLAIAKLLQLDEIPVRICVRHEKWQQHRDRMADNSDTSDYHPDLCS